MRQGIKTCISCTFAKSIFCTFSLFYILLYFEHIKGNTDSLNVYLDFDVNDFIPLCLHGVFLTIPLLVFPLNILNSFSTSVKTIYFVISVSPINKILGCYFIPQFQEISIVKFKKKSFGVGRKDLFAR